jgi:3-deoxy-D-manno-octulosonic-acid transferase
MTPTGRATGQTLWGSTVQQCYLPYDHPGAMRRFLKYWKPSLGLLMETELWPNLIAQAQAQHVPLVLINARLSERSLRRGRRFRALISPALAGLDAVIAQSAADARRLAQLGRSEVPVAGNLKFDVALPTAALERGARWRTHLAGRRLVLCASTREGEEEALLSAWCALAPAHREGLLLAIVPRHPQRFDAVAQAIVRHGWAVRRRSEGAPEKGMEQPHTAAGEVLLGDSMGEMYAWYACADVALIGGTFEPLGGQNLIEACAVGVPVILGPSTFNFSQAARSALEAGAALGVRDAREAIEQAAVLAQDPVRQLAMAQASRRFAAEHGGAVARTLELLEPFLKPLMSPDAHH